MGKDDLVLDPKTGDMVKRKTFNQRQYRRRYQFDKTTSTFFSGEKKSKTSLVFDEKTGDIISRGALHMRNVRRRKKMMQDDTDKVEQNKQVINPNKMMKLSSNLTPLCDELKAAMALYADRANVDITSSICSEITNTQIELTSGEQSFIEYIPQQCSSPSSLLQIQSLFANSNPSSSEMNHVSEQALFQTTPDEDSWLVQLWDEEFKQSESTEMDNADISVYFNSSP